MDYYLDTAYPLEQVGGMYGAVRVANYGDGSTNSQAICSWCIPAAGSAGNILIREPLAAAYAVWVIRAMRLS